MFILTVFNILYMILQLVNTELYTLNIFTLLFIFSHRNTQLIVFLCSEGCSVQSLTRIIAHRPHNSHRPVQPTPLHFTFNLHRKNWLVRDHFLHFTFYLLLSWDLTTLVLSENRESRSHQKSEESVLLYIWYIYELLFIVELEGKAWRRESYIN